MGFSAGLRGVENVTKVREKIGLELLVNRCKAANIYLLMKIIGDDRHSSLVDYFYSLTKGSHSHYSRSAASYNPCVLCPPIKLPISTALYQALPVTYV